MKRFESFLAYRLEEYLAYRRSLDYVDENLRSCLRSFDRYVKENAVDPHSLTSLFFLTLRKELRGEARTVNAVLSAARGFFQFLVRQGHCPENPLRDIPPRPENAFIPYVFSPDAVERLLRAIRKRLRHDRCYFFNDLTAYIAILLLVRCGLRISEPLRLLLSHYRRDEKTIYIKKTKFAKDRLIPLPQQTATEIDNYLAVRHALRDNDRNPFLLPGRDQKPLSANQIYPIFKQAVKDIGLKQPRRIIANTTFGAPTPHSLRHSFAVNTLKRIKQRGESPQKALPVISAYLGHRKYRYTAVYLKVLDAEQRQGLVDFAIARQEDI
ncbi:MAG: integrase [Desulfobacterales bacterium]|nr:MAG: integrase [Desulfobacterales bacterium]